MIAAEPSPVMEYAPYGSDVATPTTAFPSPPQSAIGASFASSSNARCSAMV